MIVAHGTDKKVEFSLGKCAAVHLWIHFDDAEIPELYKLLIQEKAEKSKELELPPVVLLYRSTFLTTEAQQQQIVRITNLHQHLHLIDYDIFPKTTDTKEAKEGNNLVWWQSHLAQSLSKEKVEVELNQCLRKIADSQKCVKGSLIDAAKLEILYNQSFITCLLNQNFSETPCDNVYVCDFDFYLILKNAAKSKCEIDAKAFIKAPSTEDAKYCSEAFMATPTDYNRLIPDTFDCFMLNQLVTQNKEFEKQAGVNNEEIRRLWMKDIADKQLIFVSRKVKLDPGKTDSAFPYRTQENITAFIAYDKIEFFTAGYWLDQALKKAKILESYALNPSLINREQVAKLGFSHESWKKDLSKETISFPPSTNIDNSSAVSPLDNSTTVPIDS